MHNSDELNDLRAQTAQHRLELMWTELQTCFLAVERAHFELSLGDTLEARKEYEVVCRAMQRIEQFVRAAPGGIAEIESRLVALKESLESLRLELATFPS
jgi:hypothetical protein